MYSLVLTTGTPAPGRNDSNLGSTANVVFVYERVHSLVTGANDVRARLGLKALAWARFFQCLGL